MTRNWRTRTPIGRRQNSTTERASRYTLLWLSGHRFAQPLLLQRAARENNYKDAVEARSIPWAAPMAAGPAPWKIVQTRPLTAILYEDFNHFRQLYLDGRGLPKDHEPTWLRYSVGR